MRMAGESEPAMPCACHSDINGYINYHNRPWPLSLSLKSGRGKNVIGQLDPVVWL